MKRLSLFLVCSVIGLTAIEAGQPPEKAAPTTVKVATFDVDATPPLGSAMAYDAVKRLDELTLRCRGVVILGAAKPIVLCAVDWIGIANEGHDQFCELLAEAAGTTRDRVAVHTLHQHDAPGCDFTAERLIRELGLKEVARFDGGFHREVMQRAAKAIKSAIASAQPATHYGWGVAKVKDIASNRRIYGPDGKVRAVRYTATKDAALRAEPEGVIDPELALLSFWNGSRPIALLSYYACHPQSYYRTGVPSPDFPGIARFIRGQAVPEALHVHFDGAGGNIGAGKFNDGSKENRMVLAQRLADAMKQALAETKKYPLKSADVGWETVPVKLPVAPHLKEENLIKDLKTKAAGGYVSKADQLAWVMRSKAGHAIDIACLRVGQARVLHMPGELFVEYQLAAKKMRLDLHVAMAAYGDYGPAYIGTTKAYWEGGYETSPTASNVAPEVEPILMDAMKRLLGAPTDQPAAAGPRRLQVLHKNAITSLAWSPDGKRVATETTDRTLRIMDAATGAEQKITSEDRAEANGKIIRGFPATFVSGTSEYAGCIGDGNTVVRVGVGVHVFSSSSGQLTVKRTPIVVPQGFPALAPDGLVSGWCTEEGSCTLDHQLPGRLQLNLNRPAFEVGACQCIALGPGGKLLAVGVAGQHVNLWNLAEAKSTAKLTGLKEPASKLVFSADGKSLAGLARNNLSVCVWDLTANTIRSTMHFTQGEVGLLTLSPDGRTVAATSKDGLVLFLWAAATRRLDHKGPPLSLAAEELAALWNDLANSEYDKMNHAWQRLGAAGDLAIPALRERILAVAVLPVDRKKIEKLVSDLNADKFATREQANKELLALGELAIVPLQRVLENPPSLEARLRAGLLLKKLGELRITPDHQRVLEAIELLEQARTAKAVSLIEEIERDSLVPQIRVLARHALERIRG